VELDALLGAVVEIADLAGVEAPILRHVFALSVRRAREAGCYPSD
jgi:ketopantoate reductase